MSKPVRFSEVLLPSHYGLFLIDGIVDELYFNNAVAEGYKLQGSHLLVHEIIYSLTPTNSLFDRLMGQRQGMTGIVVNSVGDVIAVGINQGGEVKWR